MTVKMKCLRCGALSLDVSGLHDEIDQLLGLLRAILRSEQRLPGASMVDHEPLDAARAALAAI